jgi:hypothetical protein
LKGAKESEFHKAALLRIKAREFRQSAVQIKQIYRLALHHRMNIFESALIEAAAPLCSPLLPLVADKNLAHEQSANGNGVQQCRRSTTGTLVRWFGISLDEYNPKIRGWWNYFGAFYRSAMLRLSQFIELKLMLGARRK